MKQAKYCQLCGVLKTEIPSGYYDGDTGEREMVLRCQNRKCRAGCEHYFKWWSARCSLCGVYALPLG